MENRQRQIGEQRGLQLWSPNANNFSSKPVPAISFGIFFTSRDATSQHILGIHLRSCKFRKEDHGHTKSNQHTSMG
jgi:hypothetical protein